MGAMRGWGISEQGWRKGPWTPEEDKLLREYVSLYGEGRWSCVSRCAGLNRSGKSCRLRWVNYLRPGLKKDRITPQEEAIIIELHALWGNKWSTIAKYLPGRTDNEIKNYWRTHFKKKTKSSQKQQERKAEILKQKMENHHEPERSRENPAEDHKMMSQLGNQLEMEFMQDNMKDQCVLTQDNVASNWAEDCLWGGLWNFDDRIIALQNQVPSFSSCVDSNIYGGGGYIF